MAAGGARHHGGRRTREAPCARLPRHARPCRHPRAFQGSHSPVRPFICLLWGLNNACRRRGSPCMRGTAHQIVGTAAHRTNVARCRRATATSSAHCAHSPAMPALLSMVHRCIWPCMHCAINCICGGHGATRSLQDACRAWRRAACERWRASPRRSAQVRAPSCESWQHCERSQCRARDIPEPSGQRLGTTRARQFALPGVHRKGVAPCML